jgi:hypothetical protein
MESIVSLALNDALREGAQEKTLALSAPHSSSSTGWYGWHGVVALLFIWLVVWYPIKHALLLSQSSWNIGFECDIPK